MLTLYAIPPSLYCAKLRILLRHKGIVWREVPPPEGYGSITYRQIVPSGSVPALVDGDLTLSDSEAIAEYLEEVFPDPAMLPGDALQRARIRERARFHDTRLEPRVRALFPALSGRSFTAEELATASSGISERLDQLAQLLKLSPPTQQLTLGDCGYPVTFFWIELLQDKLDLHVNWPKALHAWRQSLNAQSAVADEMASYRPAVTGWLTGRGEKT